MSEHITSNMDKSTPSAAIMLDIEETFDKISPKKTKSMFIAKESIRRKLPVNDKPIRQCMQCTYLRVEITSSKKVQQKIRSQINKASRIWLFEESRMEE
ncbi:hypothetical protein Trydic_g13665 [Trypoxylus dichotomus]